MINIEINEFGEMANYFNLNKPVVGLIGGMGSYATLGIFKRLLDSFKVDKEWERPHIIIDNFCTMPSRVKNIMKPDEHEIHLIIQCLSYSLKKLVDYGVDLIVLLCNTSHYYLPDALINVPEAENKILSVIDATVNYLNDRGVKKTAIVATEGTLKSELYVKAADLHDITVESPKTTEYGLIREFIEAVKNNNIDKKLLESFANYLESFSSKNIILGCTELPIMYQKCNEFGINIDKTIIDPIEIVITKIKTKYQ